MCRRRCCDWVLKTVNDASTHPSAQDQYKEALAVLESPEYRDALAERKREVLWEFISRAPYDRLPPANTNTDASLEAVEALVAPARVHGSGYVRPPRTKAFHPQGTVACVRFEADGDHPFTGLFRSGAPGFARLSLAMGVRNYGPSCAFKFLVSGPHEAQNLLVDQSLDTQTSRDFFERAPTNLTLSPTAYPLKRVFPLVHWWLSAIADPMYQPLEHLAKVTADGVVVDSPVAPRLIYLYAADERHTDPASTTDFRELLAEVPAGAELYNMFGTPDENEKPLYIGRIRTESRFVASEFGDRVLALHHTPHEPDRAK